MSTHSDIYNHAAAAETVLLCISSTTVTVARNGDIVTT